MYSQGPPLVTVSPGESMYSLSHPYMENNLTVNCESNRWEERKKGRKKYIKDDTDIHKLRGSG